MEDLKSKINEKLANIQKELKAPKSQYNSFGKYNYRSCEDIVEAVKPLLAKQGMSLVISDEVMLVGTRYYIKATAKVCDDLEEITATAYAREPEEKKGMDESQITGTASSYARKYALNGLFAIDDTKDADSLNTSKDYTAKSHKADENGEVKEQPKTYNAPNRAKNTPNNAISSEDREFLNNYFKTLPVEKYAPFFDYLQKTYNTRKLSELTNEQAHELAIRLINNKQQ